MGTRSSILKEADLMIVNKVKCNELYLKLNSTSLKNGLTAEFICAADKRLAEKLNAEIDLIDPRTNRLNRRTNLRARKRSKRTIKYWINYFSDRIKENRKEKGKELSNRSIEKLEANESNKKEDDNRDLVNLLSEDELREKLKIAFNDACQG